MAPALALSAVTNRSEFHAKSDAELELLPSAKLGLTH